jgi:bifunctional non-homologous end joining protein LigD
LPKPKLSVYRAKRDFTKTAEPSGKAVVAASSRLRFVIQKHAARRLHYDLRLQFDGVFKSWAVTRGPSLDPADKRLAVEVEDHPLEYGDFEGTIPAGEYGGGTVLLWDRGYWAPEGGKTPDAAFQSGDLKFTLDGTRLHGSWVLVRMRNDRTGGKRTNWLLIKHRDANAVPGGAEALLEEDRSVASGRTLAQIAEGVGKKPKPFMLATTQLARPDAVWNSKDRGSSSQTAPAAAPKMKKIKPLKVGKIPDFVEPQLCKLVERPPAEAGWGHEVKLDGYRAEVRVQKKRVTIRTRSGLDWTDRFSTIVRDAAGLPDCLIDGEIVALGEERVPSFSALQAALSDGDSEMLFFFAFDLLFEGKQDLRGLPLLERKARLKKLLASRGDAFHLSYVAHVVAGSQEIFDSARKLNLEGIVSKKLDAPYRSGRSGSWTKAKVRAGQEVVIGGWTSDKGSVRSLLAGVYRDGQLTYVGRVGTGYGAAIAKTLSPQLEKLTQDTSPFSGANAPPKERNVRWLKPKLVAEIEFAGWTGTGMIRQAAFKGLREDKSARDVVAEVAAAETTEDPPMIKAKPRAASKRAPSKGGASKGAPVKGGAEIMGVRLSHPDKALWPNAAGDQEPVTKLNLAEYFAEVGEWMMPHLKGRPCSLVRLPDGLGHQQFFQRHASQGMSKLFSTVKVRGDKAPYVQIDHIEALVAAAQIGTLELHPWNCAPGNPEVAGRLVFDLDPAPDVAFGAVVTAALEVRKRLKAVGLESFCKTTGGKGLHVVTPLRTGKVAVEWAVAKDFAHIICAQMAQDSPTKYLDTMSKSQRVGKIFLDYLRNDRTSTAVAVLSPRARDGATISMPVNWNAVKPDLDPQRFTVRSAPPLMKKSPPWSDYDQAARSLSDAIRAVTQAKKGLRRA